MMRTVAVVGSGILGLLVARACRASGCLVSVFEALPPEHSEGRASFAAGGMLAPFSELENASWDVARWGLQALALWPPLLASLKAQVFFRQKGSLLLSHARDWSYFQQLTARIKSQAPPSAYRTVSVGSIESELAPAFAEGLYLPDEAHLDNRQLMRALRLQLEEEGVKFHEGYKVTELAPSRLTLAQGETLSFDLICDCRGLGAASELTELRGVRGEALILHAPEVRIERPVRLMHPRYAVYIVPRAEDMYYVGATSVENSSDAPVTVRSALELLSAAYSVHKGFGEATIRELLHGVRPAFVHNEPRIEARPGLVRLNGLYRHGFLLAPFVAEQLKLYIGEGLVESQLFTFA